MSPGGTQFGDNRFALLANSPQPKRKKTFQKLQEVFPDLPPTKNDDPKYIVIKSEDPNAPLSKVSCFRVYNAILTVSKDINKISELRDGSLLLLVKNKQVAEKFIKTKHLFNIGAVSVSYHQHLNFNKGTIYAPFLNDVPESEIIEGLSAYEASSVYKFTRKSQGETKHTGVILLSFNSYTLPNKINIAWRMTTVRQYVPNPMSCKSCQKLGHTQKHCKGSPMCEICNFPAPHENDCVRVMCANCSAEHRSSDNTCPKYKQTKEILKIKTLEKCSMRDALKRYRENISVPSFTASFAQVLQPANAVTSAINTPTKISATTNSTKPKKTQSTADKDLPNSSKHNAGVTSASFLSTNSLASNNCSNNENNHNINNKHTSLNTSHNNVSQTSNKMTTIPNITLPNSLVQQQPHSFQT
ncbi:PREDICTED: uncharacterized protein LOC108370729 [Rhagoletis zephyria]|uniref:uncharacterized protein LOC108370729 n=1 Tax=Rhagoletis zephyria TaxID=28612 RepID=UPI0008116250|nr:PREDICTED: uncharacterized protein LOC108370729 [Rhagoletis zephyria]